MTNRTQPHLLGLVAGLLLAGGLVWSAMLITHAWMRVAEPQTVSVKGSAKRNVDSDLAVWKGCALVEAADLLSAQRQLKHARTLVEAFLRSQANTDYRVTPLSIDEVRVA